MPAFKMISLVKSQHLQARSTSRIAWGANFTGLLLALLTLSSSAIAQAKPADTEAKQQTKVQTAIKDARATKNKAARNRPQHCAPDATDKEVTWIDRTHARLSASLCHQAVRIDEFFGRYPDEPGDANSFVRVRNGITWQSNENTQVKISPRIRAKLHLPNTSKRFNLVFSDDLIDEDSISSSEETPLKNDNKRASYATAFRWLVTKTKSYNLDFDIGLRSKSGIKAFSQLRAQKRIPLSEKSHLDLKQQLFWQDWEGFGTRSQIEFERLITPTRLLRWVHAFTFSESSQGVDFLQRLTLFETISEKRGISFGVGANGFTRPTSKVDQYGFNIRYRKNFYRSWLFYELEPEVLWPLEQNRQLTTRMTFRLEINFGQG